MYATLAVLATRDAKRGGWCPWTVRLSWFLAGVSLFFYCLSASLGISCVFCNICHLLTVILVVTVRPFPTGVRWWHAAFWLMIGMLVLTPRARL